MESNEQPESIAEYIRDTSASLYQLLQQVATHIDALEAENANLKKELSVRNETD